MSTIVVLVIFFVWMLGLNLLWASVKSAPEGYEDETGFHHGSEPLVDDGLYAAFGEELKEASASTAPSLAAAVVDGTRPPWPSRPARVQRQHATAA